MVEAIGNEEKTVEEGLNGKNQSIKSNMSRNISTKRGRIKTKIVLRV